MNENQDLLDLCRLNLMEENIENSPMDEIERENAKKAIEWKKRHLAVRIKNEAIPASQELMERHRKQNTLNGVYPCTDALSEEIESEEKGE